MNDSPHGTSDNEASNKEASDKEASDKRADKRVNAPANMPANMPINAPSNMPVNAPTNAPVNAPANTPVNKNNLQRKQVLLIAGPIILSNISTPLLGLVDTAVIGNLGDSALIGAIAVGALIFNFLFWGFGFLRMGTTGLVAQARGAQDTAEIKASLYRALLLGLLLGIGLVALQQPLAGMVFALIDGSSAVEDAARTYFQIRIWAAPMSLMYLALLGFLLGQQRTHLILGIQILLNGSNIILDLVFVVGLDWGVAGLAAATLVSEVLATALGTLLVIKEVLKATGSLRLSLARLFQMTALRRMFSVNRDIMIRTLCLIFVFAWFTNQGAAAGDLLLATNAILMQFVTFSAFFLDGYALAGESLVGNAIGGKNPKLLHGTLKAMTQLGFVTALVLSLGFYFSSVLVIDVLTNVEAVRQSTRDYIYWAVLAPIVSLWCYLLDGVFIGATKTQEMRNAMLLSLGGFLLAWYFLMPLYGNHGLWLSLYVFFILRALSLLGYVPRIFAELRPQTQQERDT